jgi:hypothetical protein
MGLKVLARLAVLLAIALALVTARAQSAGATSGESNPTGSEGGLHSYQPTPRVTVTTAPPTPKAWTWQEEVTWGANIVLAAVGYVGVWLGFNLLKKIERHIAFGESAAESAAASAHAALLNAQAVIHSERPWILISVDPSRSKENSFTVMATNRGRTPARITATAEQAMIAVDEKYLPIPPEYDRDDTKPALVPIILVPGESTAIKSFCREDVKPLCDSEERFRRIETWEEKIFLYGKVVYKDLISPPDGQDHETNWCCWYIHGRQNSGLVIAGPPEYNAHT